MTIPPILSDFGLVTQGDDQSWAVTSPDNQFRYLLARFWKPFGDGPLIVYGMMNPSKARHDVPDPTIRKCIGFGKRLNAAGFIVVNMLAYSATDPDDMVKAHKAGINVVGEHNGLAIRWALTMADLAARTQGSYVIAAWGKIPPKVKPLAKPSIDQFAQSNTHCFGVNKDGSPRHPLMLGYKEADHLTIWPGGYPLTGHAYQSAPHSPAAITAGNLAPFKPSY